MKKFKSVLIIGIAFMMSISVLGGCSNSDEDTLDYNAGSWIDDTTYQNESTGMEFTLPEDWNIADDTELETIKESAKSVVESEIGEEVQTLDEYMSYEFVIYTGSESIQVYTENIKNTTGDIDISEDEYLKNVKAELDDSGYDVEYNDTVEKTIAGKEFTSLTYSVNDGSVYQEYAIYNLKGYMIQIVATYYEETQDTIDTILSDNFIELE